MVAGSSGQEESLAELEDSDLKALVETAIAQGSKPNQAIKQVAKDHGLTRQVLYNIYHDL